MEHLYTSGKETLLNYKFVASLLKLEKKDKAIDMRLLNDSFLDMCYYIGRPLDIQQYEEKRSVKDLKAFLCRFPVIKILSVSMKVKNRTVCLDPKEYLLDKEQNCIAFADENYNGMEITVRYTAGFDAKSLPDDLKEAGIKLFINKYSLYKSAADYAVGDDIDDVIEQKFEDGILDPDDFFDRFSTIPHDVLPLLDRYRICEEGEDIAESL